MLGTLSLVKSNIKKRNVTDPNDKSIGILGKNHRAITIDKLADRWNSRLLSEIFNIKTFLPVACDIIHYTVIPLTCVVLYY